MQAGETTDAGLTALVGQLASDVREVASAELALVKAQAVARVARYRRAAVFFAIAGVLALAALIALLIGAIQTLATLIGPGLATLAVCGGTLLVATILGLIGKRRLAGPA